MPNTPQPGRIPPIQLPNKTSGNSTESASNPASEAKKIAGNPTGAATEQVTGAVTARFSASDSRKRLNRAIKEEHLTNRIPINPQYRISLFEGGILIAVSVVIDAIDYIAGLFCETGIGELVVMIVDALYGILLACYCRFRLKLPILAHMPIYISILGAEFVDNIPLINAMWWADAWFIIHSVRAEDRQIHQQLHQVVEGEQEEKDREEWMKNYQKQQMIEDQQEKREPETVEYDQEELMEGRVASPKPTISQKEFNSNPQTAGRLKPPNQLETGRIAA